MKKRDLHKECGVTYWNIDTTDEKMTLKSIREGAKFTLKDLFADRRVNMYFLKLLFLIIVSYTLAILLFYKVPLVMAIVVGIITIGALGSLMRIVCVICCETFYDHLPNSQFKEKECKKN